MASVNYSSANITMVAGGKTIVGWADGDFVKVSYSSDYWTLTMGSDGVGTRSCTRDLSGTIEITLLASSPSNDYLSALFLADRQSGAGVFPFMLREAGGALLATAESMWVVKAPDVSFSRAVSTRVWQLMTDRIELTPAGTVVPAAV